MDKLIRINMTDKTVKIEELPAKYAEYGARALTSRIVNDEVPATCHPLGPYNKLVIAPGILTGTTAPSSGRLSLGAKSPQTGGIKESNAGTPLSQKLGRLGIRAIVVEGQESEGMYLLKVDVNGAELLPAEDLQDKTTGEINRELFGKYGEKVGIMTIGPTGDYKMVTAGVCFNDPEGRASRYAGRGGLGAVLGSKGLKAMVVDAEGASGVAIKDKELFKSGQKKLVEALRTHGVTKPGGALNKYGTAGLINTLNEAGGLPTNNFRTGYFDNADKISGETIAQTINERGAGMTGHSCHKGCVIRCSNVFPKKDGSLVSCVEYESDWALGANCGIDNLDAIVEMIDICNEIGIDTIEAGVTIAVLMDAGVIRFGDYEGAIRLLKEVGRGTPMGRIVGNGADFAGKAFGEIRVPTSKGQGMPAYEPRACKGIGVTYITTPMGADHTAGYTVASEILAMGAKMDPLSYEGKVEASREAQKTVAFNDSTGCCQFILFALMEIPSGRDGLVEMVNAIAGTEISAEDIEKIGMETLKVEWAFNKRAGFTNADNRIPEFMRYEKLPPLNEVYDINEEELDKIWLEFEKEIS